MTFDPADAATVPPEIRKPALRLAFEAVDGYLRETGYALDFFGRLQPLDRLSTSSRPSTRCRGQNVSAHPPEVDRSAKS